jgi:tight adherence protein B
VTAAHPVLSASELSGLGALGALPAVDPGQAIAKPVLVFALLAFFLGSAVLIATVLGAATRAGRPEERMRRRLSFYTLSGRQVRLETQVQQSGVLGNSAIARSAVELAGRVTKERGLGDVIDGRLDAAGVPMRTPEWLLVHLGSTVGLSLLFLLLSGGSLVGAIVGLLLGLAAPWMVLVIRQGRRESAFLAQLPDTLQMLAGSLQAGYSLPQALDTVVREGQPPMSVEFNRALVESRLGMPVEDALEGIGRRLESQDFSWVVMAVRIQRDVGGNLAELLMTVAETLRERERLRRQVKVLSAEGRLSGWILGSLPVVFFVYLTLANPTYLAPLYSTTLGIAMMITAVVLLAVGAFWLSRVVKVEV